MEKSERIKRFEKLLAMDPLDSTAYFGLGQAYFNESFLIEAEQTVNGGSET